MSNLSRISINLGKIKPRSISQLEKINRSDDAIPARGNVVGTSERKDTKFMKVDGKYALLFVLTSVATAANL